MIADVEQKNIAEKIDIDVSMVSKLVKSHDKSHEDLASSHCKRMRASSYLDIESVLLEWFKQSNIGLWAVHQFTAGGNCRTFGERDGYAWVEVFKRLSQTIQETSQHNVQTRCKRSGQKISNQAGLTAATWKKKTKKQRQLYLNPVTNTLLSRRYPIFHCIAFPKQTPNNKPPSLPLYNYLIHCIIT